MTGRIEDGEMLLKRGHFIVAIATLIILIMANALFMAYTAGQLTEKLNTIAVALLKIDNVPARVLVLEQADREHERRMTEMDRHIDGN